jgi:hypothetical protein
MVQHEYIKRSDVGCFLFLSCDLSNFMGDVMSASLTGVSVASVVTHALHATIKNEIKQRFIELIVKDIEPILTEYANQIVTQVYEMKDPYSMDGLKINVTFKLPEMK